MKYIRQHVSTSIIPRGFTLIELLTVVAIIGILASIVLVSLNGTRGQGRDGQRIANLQEMTKAMYLVDPDTSPLTTCTVDGADASTCSGPSPLTFARFKDPSTPGITCTNASVSTCQYMITGLGNIIRANNFQICTYLENGLSIGGTNSGKGLYRISTSTGGSVAVGCF